MCNWKIFWWEFTPPTGEGANHFFPWERFHFACPMNFFVYFLDVQHKITCQNSKSEQSFSWIKFWRDWTVLDRTAQNFSLLVRERIWKFFVIFLNKVHYILFIMGKGSELLHYGKQKIKNVRNWKMYGANNSSFCTVDERSIKINHTILEDHKMGIPNI